MRNGAWSESTSDEEMQRRAGGRRLYNGVRQCRAALRRRELMTIVVRSRLKLLEHGTQARLARQLGVSRSTVCRDMKRIFAEARARGRCPFCQTRSFIDRDRISHVGDSLESARARPKIERCLTDSEQEHRDRECCPGFAPLQTNLPRGSGVGQSHD
jgi:hypothetical protein